MERDTQGTLHRKRVCRGKESNGVKDRMTEIRGGGGGRERLSLACGNSVAVFMDVYLSASPTGSSHFPLGSSWSAGGLLLVGSREAGGQLSDATWDKVAEAHFSISICLYTCNPPITINSNLNQSCFFFQDHQSLVKIQRSCKCLGEDISLCLHIVSVSYRPVSSLQESTFNDLVKHETLKSAATTLCFSLLFMWL